MGYGRKLSARRLATRTTKTLTTFSFTMTAVPTASKVPPLPVRAARKDLE